jgi:hypothetical protein
MPLTLSSPSLDDSMTLVVALLSLSLTGTTAPAAAPSLADYLRACGIGDSDLARFSDDRQMADEELDVVHRLAVRLRDCPADSLRRMIAQETASASFNAKWRRGQTLRLRGRVDSVEQVEDSLWRCMLACETPPHRVIIYVGQVSNLPNSRQIGNLPHENIAVGAMFVKYVPGVRDQPVPVCVAGRLQRRAVGSLGRLDFNSQLLDEVRDNSPLVAGDSAAFYRLLDLTKTADLASLHSEAGTLNADIARDLFHDPVAARGRLFHVTGTGRRVVRVPIDDPAAATELGTDHYFQIELLVDALQDNPLTFCTLELPPGMPLGGPPDYSQPIEATGFFLKTWHYPTRLTAGERAAQPDAVRALQTAPLLIGPAPQWKPVPTAKEDTLGWGFAGILALAMTGLGLLLWSLRQSDLEFSNYVRRAFQPDSCGQSGSKA